MLISSFLLLFVACESSDWDRHALTGPEANRLVASVEIRPSGAVLEPDAVEQFAAVVKSARGQTVSRNVTWRSLDEDVLRVDPDGVVLGMNEGVATLEATHQGVTGRSTVDIQGEVVEIRLDRASLDLSEGESAQLSATYVYANGAQRPAGPLEWRSDDTSILMVDSEGRVRGIFGGTTRLRVRGRGHETWVNGRVRTTAVAAVVVSAPTLNLGVGEEVQVWAEVRDAAGNRLYRPIEWSSSNSSVATVSSGGVVSGRQAGDASIRARVENATGSLQITVGSSGGHTEARPGAVTNLAVALAEANAVTLRFREVDDGTGRPASYDIRYTEAPIGLGWGSAMSVARGSCSVPVSGTSIGATRTCTVEGLQPGTRYDFQLVPFRGTMQQDAVYGPLSNVATGTTQNTPIQVQVLPSGATLEVNEELQLRASVTDAYGNTLNRTVSWSSSRSSVASVSASGNNARVQALNPGDTDIRARTDGAEGASMIRVTQRLDSGPGEPGGFQRMAEHDFSCRPGAGCGRAGAWGESTNDFHRNNLSLGQSSDAPLSPSGVVVARFPSGMRAGIGPVNFWGWDTQGREFRAIYISKWVRIRGPDYQNHPGITKMGWIGYGEGTVGNHGFFTLQTQPNTGQMEIVTDLQPAFRQQNHVNRVLYGWPKMKVGEWAHWEAVFELNDLGRENGVFKWWINGRLVASATDMVYITRGKERGFYAYRFNPTWGGTGDFTRTRDDFMEIDHIYISGIPK